MEYPTMKYPKNETMRPWDLVRITKLRYPKTMARNSIPLNIFEMCNSGSEMRLCIWSCSLLCSEIRTQRATHNGDKQWGVTSALVMRVLCTFLAPVCVCALWGHKHSTFRSTAFLNYHNMCALYGTLHNQIGFYWFEVASRCSNIAIASQTCDTVPCRSPLHELIAFCYGMVCWWMDAFWTEVLAPWYCDTLGAPV